MPTFTFKEVIKSFVNSVIIPNGVNSITGQQMNDALIQMIDSLSWNSWSYKSEFTPSTGLDENGNPLPTPSIQNIGFAYRAKVSGVFNTAYGEVTLSVGDFVVSSYRPTPFDDFVWIPLIFGGGSSAFNGDRPIKRQPHIGLNVGGLTITDFLEAFYFPFIKASISIDGDETYEVGSAPSVSIEGIITPNDENTISSRRIERNGISVATFTENTYSVNNNIPQVNIESTVEFITKCLANNQGAPETIQSEVKNIFFKYRRFFGTSTSVPINSTQVRALSSSSFSEIFDIEIPQGEQLAVISYPASLPDLVKESVLYLSSYGEMSIGDLFDNTLVNVEDAGGNVVSYKVYKYQVPDTFPEDVVYRVNLNL